MTMALINRLAVQMCNRTKQRKCANQGYESDHKLLTALALACITFLIAQYHASSSNLQYIVTTWSAHLQLDRCVSLTMYSDAQPRSAKQLDQVLVGMPAR
jgi:uroporphyrinogen-III decarboxylase